VLAYLRKDENETILVALNFNCEEQSLTLPAGKWEALFSESCTGEVSGSIDLQSDEVLLLKAN